MNKRDFISTLLIVFITFSFFAQQKNKKFTLKWKNTDIMLHDGQSVNISLLENKLFNEDFLPAFSEMWKVSPNLKVNSYRISNVSYRTISKKNYPKTTNNSFPTKIESSFDIKNDRDDSYALLNLTPILLENGILKRIESFELEYQFVPKQKIRNFSTIHDSPLATGTWYKFAVDTTGVFKLDKSFLNSLGINSGSINPKNIRIFGNGGAMLNELNSDFRYDDLQENAIFVAGEDDNSFDSGDYILFYAEGSHIWKPDFVNEKFNHQNNIYSDKAYYFITVDNGLGKRITNNPIINDNANLTINTFNDYVLHEKDIRNEGKLGQLFYGESFGINDTQTFSFNFTDVDVTKDIEVKLNVVTSSIENTNFSLNLNGQNIINLPVNGLAASTILVGRIGSATASTSVSNENLQVEVHFDNEGRPSAKGFLDYIEINGSKNLIARDKQFAFRSFQEKNVLNSDIVEYSIQNSDQIFQVWNVSDKVNPTVITNQSSGSDFLFKTNGGTLKEYIILNENDYYQPELLTDRIVENQNLHALQDIDYLIITESELVDQAQRLANYHQENSNFNTLVLTEQKIYNEFSSGAKDATAIRDFIRHLYMNASTNDKRIQHVLFFGDASFDFKNIEGNNTVNVIAFQSILSLDLANSFVTDDFFCMMDDNEGFFSQGASSIHDLKDVASGRMPVKNLEEAQTAIDKTLRYYDKISFGDWRNHISMVADDLDKPSEIVLEEDIEKIADSIKSKKPAFNITKIYADAFVQEIDAGGERYPQVNVALNNAVERGSLIINYFGHGGENGWTSERILDVPQIQNWYNPKTSPLMITITCEFSRFDNPVRNTAGEFVFSNKNGGSTAMLTTTREVYIFSGSNFNVDLMEDLLEFNTNQDYTIAESLKKTKNRNSSYGQRFFIYLFGDPAMKLAKAKPNIKITQMNDVDITQQLDTIKALSHIKFKGTINNPTNNSVLTDFNGVLSATIFDKSVDRSTLNNDGHFDSNGNPSIITFDSRESKIFKGKASVVNGEWEFDFIAPRDLRIAFGNAKISFYADNQVFDKSGYNVDVIIGGINENAPEDNIGPTIKLFMNDESFIDGGNTNQSPLFLAVLEDESGINTSLTAVDHDIIAVLDGDQSNPIIMNDFYETELNDFTKGKVEFPFRNLEVGLHTISFKCWDTYNNPSEATLNFVVVSDSDLILDHVLNYPNPFINYTEFWFNHNKPNEPLEAQVQIFTVSGKLIKTINRTVTTGGLVSGNLISWNGLDDFGNKIGKGVYIYKLNVKAISSNIKAEKFEKLVILQ